MMNKTRCLPMMINRNSDEYVTVLVHLLYAIKKSLFFSKHLILFEKNWQKLKAKTGWFPEKVVIDRIIKSEYSHKCINMKQDYWNQTNDKKPMNEMASGWNGS